MTLGRLELLFDLTDASVEIVHQVLLLRIGSLPLRLGLELTIRVLDFFLEVLDLLFVLLYDFLAEVRPFSKLFLDLFVVLQVLAQVCDDAFHLVVAEHQVFRPLRLVIQLGCELHVLDNGELGRTLQLVLISH